jgi:hypothetical protein
VEDAALAKAKREAFAAELDQVFAQIAAEEMDAVDAILRSAA